MKKVLKHPFLLSCLGVIASFGLVFLTVALCKPFLPLPGIRSQSFDKTEISWVVDEVVEISSGWKFESDAIEDESTKVIFIESQSSLSKEDFLISAYVDEGREICHWQPSAPSLYYQDNESLLVRFINHPEIHYVDVEYIGNEDISIHLYYGGYM